MPVTKKNPATSAANGSVPEVFTLVETAAFLRVSEEDVLQLVGTQSLPGRLISGDWRFLKSAVEHWLSIGSSRAQSRKDAQLALAGKYKDDPDLLRICEDAYKARGRSEKN